MFVGAPCKYSFLRLLGRREKRPLSIQDCRSCMCKIPLSQTQASAVVSDSLRPHWLQHSSLPCPSPIPGACSDSCPSSQWCYPTISLRQLIIAEVLWAALYCGILLSGLGTSFTSVTPHKEEGRHSFCRWGHRESITKPQQGGVSPRLQKGLNTKLSFSWQ